MSYMVRDRSIVRRCADTLKIIESIRKLPGERCCSAGRFLFCRDDASGTACGPLFKEI